MEKNVIKLNENQLRNMVSGSVKSVLKEMLGESWGPDAPSPSDFEEEFEDRLYELIEDYKDKFLALGYTPKDLLKWCCEVITSALK